MLRHIFVVQNMILCTFAGKSVSMRLHRNIKNRK